jgi:O-antigen ligase
MGLAGTSRIGAVLATGLALPLGALAVGSPRFAFAAVLALGFVALAAHDIAAGVAAFTILALIGQVPPLAGSPAIKLAGAVLVILLLVKDLALLRLLRERPTMAVAAVFFVVWAGSSSLWAQDGGVAVRSAFRLALGVVFVFVVYAAVRERQHVRWIAYALVAGALLTSLIGVVSLGGLSTYSGRLAGGAGNPNELAAVLVPALALAGFASTVAQSRRSRLLLGMSCVGIVLALLGTGSRGGLVGLAVSLAVAVAFGGALRMPIVALVAIVVGLGVGYYTFVASPFVRDRVVHFSSGGGTGRTDVWKVATAVARDHPILGVGAGNFPVIEPEYAVRAINLSQIQLIVDTPKVVHNTYLEVQTELGAPGLIAFLLVVGGAIASTFGAIRGALAAGDRELEFLARGSLVALAGYLAAATFGSSEYGTPLWLFLGLATAMSAVAWRSVQRH